MPGLLRNSVVSVKVDLQHAAFEILADTIAGSALVPRLLRVPLLRLAGIRVGRAHVWPGVFFTSRRVSIGEQCVVNRGCWFDAHGVTIGDYVEIGYGVMFVTAAHDVGPSHHRSGRGEGKPIVVEDGCWIGARTTIMPGVTIKKGCIIAAGTLVRSDCEPDGLYAGVPNRRVRDLD